MRKASLEAALEHEQETAELKSHYEEEIAVIQRQFAKLKSYVTSKPPLPPVESASHAQEEEAKRGRKPKSQSDAAERRK